MAPPEAAPAGQARPSLLARLLTRQGSLVALCLLALTLLAWWWLWRHGMAAPDNTMGAMADMPGMAMPGAMAAPPDVWSSEYLAATFAMWAVMMVAMMLPSAAPMVLFHDMFSRRNGLGAAATLAFAGSYLVLWVLFAFAAALAQAALVASGAVSAASLALGNAVTMALLLALAALYQFSPLKRRCLANCQSPVDFLTRHWRPGLAGAVTMGLRHGAYCIGCCWVLMLLLFAGGVMNLAWIAALSLVVLSEKYAPPAWRIDRALAAALLVATVAVWRAS